MGRYELAAHDQRSRAHRGVLAQRGRRQDDAVGSQRRTGFECDGVEAHHPIVEQVGLDYTAAVDRGVVTEADEVGLRQPVGLAPHTVSDVRPHRPQVPHDRGCAHGVAGEPGSGHEFDEAVGDLVAPDERRPQRMLPGPDGADEDPFRGHGQSRRHGTGDHHHDPRGEQGQQHRGEERRRLRGHAAGQSEEEPDGEDDSGDEHTAGDDRRDPQRLPEGASGPDPEGRGIGERFVGLHGGATQLHRGRAEPRRSLLRLRRRRREHRNEGVLRHPATGGGDSRIAEEGPFADLRATGPHPAVAEFVAGDHGVIGEEGARGDRRHLRDEDDGRDLRARSHPGPEEAQPPRGEHRGVEGEQQVPGHIEQTLRRPHPVAAGRTDGELALLHPEGEDPYGDEDEQGRGEEPQAGCDR